MGSQRIVHDWATELNWLKTNHYGNQEGESLGRCFGEWRGGGVIPLCWDYMIKARVDMAGEKLSALFFLLFKNFYLFICYIWLHWVFAVWGLSPFVASRGYSLVVVCGLLLVVASLVVEYRLWRVWASIVGAQRLSCPEACGIFLEQGSNLWPLHW